jgi:hypothetical protein
MEPIDMSSASHGREIKSVDFVVDEDGEKTAVLIDLKRHRLLREDFHDTTRPKQREREPRESLEAVVARK